MGMHSNQYRKQSYPLFCQEIAMKNGNNYNAKLQSIPHYLLERLYEHYNNNLTLDI